MDISALPHVSTRECEGFPSYGEEEGCENLRLPRCNGTKPHLPSVETVVGCSSSFRLSIPRIYLHTTMDTNLMSLCQERLQHISQNDVHVRYVLLAELARREKEAGIFLEADDNQAHLKA
ncbi:hypothetical protein V8G54_030367 [Vigna mungo]|uniref:Uncharacterized protein n=1 Tax=Vigna mungo TaxID=3915 RepID=A0AAQ3RL87_VIGMU